MHSRISNFRIRIFPAACCVTAPGTPSPLPLRFTPGPPVFSLLVPPLGPSE